MSQLTSIAREHRSIGFSVRSMPTLQGQNALVFYKAEGIERLGEDFSYTITCLTPATNEYVRITPREAANLDTGALIGQSAQIRIKVPNGPHTRYIHGMITSAGFAGMDRERALYKIIMQSPLAKMHYVRDMREFRNHTAPEIIRKIVEAHGIYCEFHLNKTYPVLDYKVWYGETAYEFLMILLQTYGIYPYFYHDEHTATVRFIDHMSGHPTRGRYAEERAKDAHILWYHDTEQRLEYDHIRQLTTQDQQVTQRFSHTDYDFKQPMADLRTGSSKDHITEGFIHIEYPSNTTDLQHSENLSQIRLEQHMMLMRTLQGFGHIRDIECGDIFKLQGFPSDIVNNKNHMVHTLRMDMHEVDSRTKPTHKHQYLAAVNTTFEAIPAGTPFRLQRTIQKRRALGLQPALVVGESTEGSIFTDEHGRVKIHFHWNQYDQKNSQSSCWVRVASSMAGGQLGFQAIPRVGEEVLIGFHEGDPERPFVVARMHNTKDQPAFQLPHEEILMGLRSRELIKHGGNSEGRSNHILLDDSEGHIQAELRSDHAESRLTLGKIRDLQGHSGRGQTRGEGFSLETNAWGAIRAAQGALLTTHSGGGDTPSLENSTPQRQMIDAASLHEERSKHAEGQKALPLEHTDALHAFAKTSFDQTVAHRDVKGFAKPILALASQDDLALVSSRHVHVVSQEDTHLVSQKHLNLAVAKHWLASIGEKCSLFVHKGIQLFSHKGKIDIQAQTDGIDMLAKELVRIMSIDGGIELSTKKDIVLKAAGGSYIKLGEAGIEIGTSGTIKFHAVT